MESIWTKTAMRPTFKKLQGDISTDVLIIGGGLAGILCAYTLKERGIPCVLVEAERICGGITKNTTAKITLQHGLIYDETARRFGIDGARLYYKAQKKALEKYRQLCREIPCDYEEQPSFVYSQKDLRKLEREAEVLNRIGCPADLVTSLPLPVSALGAVRIPQQGQFHPLKFAFHLAKALSIYEHTKVKHLSGGTAFTEDGRIRFQKAIVATHFPFINKHGSYFLKLYQHRSYVLALENAPDVQGMYVDEDEKGLSFRNHQGLLLLGGGSHRTGKQGGNWKELEAFAHKYYPQAKILNRWATQDCMTLDDIPYIGPYSARTPNLFVATGFNKWGMTSSMVAARILGDMVEEKENEYAAVFSPSRTMLRPQLFLNIAESAAGLLCPTVPRCPHLGCALKYNAAEHSWDCSCHGSRFTEDGKLIDNPARKNLS